MTDRSRQTIWIKRSHGLGNVVLLLPVLDKLVAEGRRVAVATREEWASAFSALRPGVIWATESPTAAVDLDALTSSMSPKEHRTDEFGRLLGMPPPFPAPSVTLPEEWTRPFERLRGCVVLAPEAAHRARRWGEPMARDLAARLACLRACGGTHRQAGLKLVLAGGSPGSDLPCHADLRGRTRVHELMALLSVAGAVICMDSGVLHLAAAVGTPTVAIFGGVDPKYRIRAEQRVVALHAALPCWPCNKLESCDGSYDCLKAVGAVDVIKALSVVGDATGLSEMTVPAGPESFPAAVAMASLVAPA